MKKENTQEKKKRKEIPAMLKKGGISKEEKERNPGNAEKEKIIIRAGKFYAVIGYFWILCFVPLLLRKDNSFAVHHGKNGLMLFLAWLACLIISVFPIIGHIISFVGIIFIMILSIQGIIHSLKGEYWHMPLLGSHAEKLNL